MSKLLQKFKKKKAGDSPDSSSNSKNKKKSNKKGNPSETSSNTSSEVRGILKNKTDAEKYHNNESYPTSDDLDESLRNARKNMNINLKVTKNKNSDNSETASNILNETDEPLPSNAKEVASDDTLTAIDKNDNNATDTAATTTNGTNNNNDNNNNNNNNNNETESKADNDIEMNNGPKKDVYWDEDNLRQNEEEKVPRMKIDEAPTPYHEMPDELLDDSNNAANDQIMGDNEEILDINPMDMMDTASNDGDDISSQNKSADSINSNEKNAAPNAKSLQQERQAALLQDSEYRDKMINDALKRREDDIASAEDGGQKKPKKKVIRAAWEDDTDMTGSANDVSDDSQASKQKQDFKKKRSAHYNEFYAVKAMRAKMNQDGDDDE